MISYIKSLLIYVVLPSIAIAISWQALQVPNIIEEYQTLPHEMVRGPIMFHIGLGTVIFYYIMHTVIVQEVPFMRVWIGLLECLIAMVCIKYFFMWLFPTAVFSGVLIVTLFLLLVIIRLIAYYKK